MNALRFFVALSLLLGSVTAAAESTGFGGQGGGELLPPEQAFILGTDHQADNSLVLHWTIAPDYYLYRDRMEFRLLEAGDARLGEPVFAPAKTKQDPFFGETAVYYDETSVRLPLKGEPASGAMLELVYQGCNEPIGVCYPPVEQTLALASFGAAAAGPPLSEQGRIAAALTSANIAWTVLIFVGFGLLLTFTPCVFPMVPILVGVISGDRGGGGTRAGRAAALSAVFVLCMALTYAAVGVAVGLSGASLQAWFQKPWVIALFAAVFVLLALATFGLFHLQTPHALRHALERYTSRLGGSISGAAVLGITSAVIVSPCVTPPLIGALLYIAQTGDPVIGGVALFALGIGMGIPLLIVGACAGHLLPRAGQWMQPIRIALGIGLLAVAIWLLQRILPTAVTMALWAVLLIGTGVQLGALSAATNALARTWKAVGVVLLLYGALLLVGAAGGGQSALQPLRGVFSDDNGNYQTAREFRSVDGLAGLRQALSEARSRGQPVMLDVYADWCVACQELEAFTFPDRRVRRALGQTLLLRADVTANDARDRALLQRFDIYGPPAVLFFGPDGIERRGGRLVGFVGPEAFAEHVRGLLPEASS